MEDVRPEFNAPESHDLTLDPPAPTLAGDPHDDDVAVFAALLSDESDPPGARDMPREPVPVEKTPEPIRARLLYAHDSLLGQAEPVRICVDDPNRKQVTIISDDDVRIGSDFDTVRYAAVLPADTTLDLFDMTGPLFYYAPNGSGTIRVWEVTQ